MNVFVKSKIKANNLLFKQYIQNSRFVSDFRLLENVVNELNDLISSTKALYYDNLAKKTKQSVTTNKNILVNP